MSEEWFVRDACDVVCKHLQAYLDNELEPRRQFELEQHFLSCEPCRLLSQRESKMHYMLRDALGGAVSASPAFRSQVQEVLARERRRTTRKPVISMSRFREHHGVWLAAATLLLGFVGTAYFWLQWFSQGFSHETVEVNASIAASANRPLEDVVQFHNSELPADVSGSRLPEMTRFIRTKAGLSAPPAFFRRADVRLIGARVSNVGSRRAAAYYYEVDGKRLTLVVFEPESSMLKSLRRVRLQNGKEVFYTSIHGFTVPLQQYGGLAYAFTGDLHEEALLELAASAQFER